MTFFESVPDAVLVLRNLGIAVTAGFVVGFEREWTQALEKQQHAFAGARTFALIGMIGGLAGLLGEGALLPAAALVVVGALTVLSHWFEAKESPGRGGTTEMAIFATLLLGVAAGCGHIHMAAAGGVLVAIILSMKSAIKGWMLALDRREIHAALRFLAISVLVLPALPDTAFGPYGALNPRVLWAMVVLISGLSFLGYWLMKLMGEGRGALAVGIVGGLASSTATTLSLSNFVREGQSGAKAAAAGIVMANVIMMLRVGVILAVISKAVFTLVAFPLGAAAAIGAICALALWRLAPKDAGSTGVVAVGNPFEIRPAIYFAAMIAIISIVSSYAAEKFGAAGSYAVGALSGLADVDAMTLSGGRQAATGALPADIAAGAILLAVLANIFVKGSMSVIVGGAGVGMRVIAAFGVVTVAGALVFFAA